MKVWIRWLWNCLSVCFFIIIYFAVYFSCWFNKFVYFFFKGWCPKAGSAWSSAPPCCSWRSSCPYLKANFKSFCSFESVLCHKSNFLSLFLKILDSCRQKDTVLLRTLVFLALIFYGFDELFFNILWILAFQLYYESHNFLLPLSSEWHDY